MAIVSGSCRYRVVLQSAAGWLTQSAAGWLVQSAAGSRPGRAVGREAGRSGRTVGLRGFASPDVLKYRLAVLGVSVVIYSDREGPYIIEEVNRSGAIKIKNAEGTNPKLVNGQRIKHYISGTPINIETNIINTIAPEEYIRETYQNVSDSEKE